MKVALLHLCLSGGPEKVNLQLLTKAIGMAANEGAKWIVTPEMAVQGYFSAIKENKFTVPIQPAPYLDEMRQLIKEYRLTLFLGCAEKDEKTGKDYNSCLVFGPKGQVLGRHRKMHNHGGDTEAWAVKGETLAPVFCPEMQVGILICADSWFVNHAKELKDQGAEVVVVTAAWKPGEYGPEDCWERCSKVSGLPVWVCNQTGSQEKLDFTQAESVIIINGEKRLTYSGEQQCILLFDWDLDKRDLESKIFTRIKV